MKNFKSFALACSLAFALSACGISPPQPAPLMHTETVTVAKQVPVPCVDSIPQPAQPFLTDKALLTGSGAQVADQLWADHLEQKDYVGELLAVLQGCVKPQSLQAAAFQ